VWESALRVEAEREARVQISQPGPEVLALLQAREAARSQKNWEQADALRDQVADLGWQINDTAEGSQLVRLEP
ncbi:MAG: hypothetical protein ACK2T5_02145, partial [Anaerolineales bacterium]